MLERLFRKRSQKKENLARLATCAIARTALQMKKEGESIPPWMMESLDKAVNDFLPPVDQQKKVRETSP